MSDMYYEGEVLAGKYRVEKLLGQGGMGVVVAARHVQLQELVAVKLMLADDSNEEAMQRFVREARAAARLESSHVARVSDVGSLGDGRAYLVMEHLDGQDLAQLIAIRGRLPASEAVDYLLQACEAIAEAHSLGIVHRDLKPSNLFLTRRRDRTPHVKVLDFGISKMATPSIARIPITRTSSLMGSPLYMSPEQLTSTKYVDARSDIWALGVVLYELLGAQSPFNGETLPQVCAMVMQEPPLPLLQAAPGLPSGLEQVVLGCLEKKPEARFQNLGELALALAPFASPLGKISVERILRLLGVSANLPVAEAVLGQTVVLPAATNPLAVTAPSSARANWVKKKDIPGLKSRVPVVLGAAALLAALAAVVAFAPRAERPGHDPGKTANVVPASPAREAGSTLSPQAVAALSAPQIQVEGEPAEAAPVVEGGDASLSPSPLPARVVKPSTGVVARKPAVSGATLAAKPGTNGPRSRF